MPLSELCRTAGPSAPGPGAADPRRDRRRRRRGPRAGHPPPRPQARQRPALRRGGRPAVKVLDFGLAEIAASPSPAVGRRRPATGQRAAAGHLTATDDLLGTPLYVAPEVIRHAAGQPRLGHLLVRRDRLRDAGRQAAVRGIDAGGAGRASRTGASAGSASAAGSGAPCGMSWRKIRPCVRRTAGEAVHRLRAAAGRERGARWRRTEVPRRLVLSALLAAAVAVAGLPPSPPACPPSSAGLMTCASAPRRHVRRTRGSCWSRSTRPASPSSATSLADRADEIGEHARADVRGGSARRGGRFPACPAQWSASRGFSDLVLRHRGGLTLAAFSNPDGNVLGTGSVAGLTAAALGPRRSAALFGFVNLDEDQDGVDPPGRLGSATARAASGPRGPRGPRDGPGSGDRARGRSDPKFWIDHGSTGSRYARISWRQLPGALDRNPWAVPGPARAGGRGLPWRGGRLFTASRIAPAGARPCPGSRSRP